ncbi:uncharacterized protein LOC104903161 [Beta vulgaris subsp. vulgaris]|uniref:uncharacterized protein LOC104903161 n=1 Tax=Beta vulgaris subsp. vulgaris TaxID=3555 RepID=UPI00053F9016|nr:uncharacterized protein LOC104903161 [Beta vulgaris subsp. vulgaris]
MISLESESERPVVRTSEENDILQRSKKKFKRALSPSQLEGGSDVSMSPSRVESNEGNIPQRSYSQATRGFEQTRNPLFEGLNEGGDFSSDEEVVSDEEEEDSNCPTIHLTREEKRRIRSPWRNALIIKLFDKRLGYEVLMRRLNQKWSLKGQIALTDVGYAYYVVRFSNNEDYNFVLTQGPWMIGDSYLTIRKWTPNFVSDEAPIKTLTAWVRIPHLSVEYFDKHVLHKIGSKIGRVIKIDRNTESMDRGQYVRFCVEVDLTKPLLSKFKLNKRVWMIQYEGLKMICFKCGHLGHKEDGCPVFREPQSEERVVQDTAGRSNLGAYETQDSGWQSEVQDKSYGAWMIVQRQVRR